MSYTCKLRSVGNPDYGQYAPVSVPLGVETESLAGITRMAKRYVADWNLGGGNWPTIIVKRDGKPFAVLGYNGTLWDVKDRSREIEA